MTTHAPNTSKSNRRSRLGFTMMEMLTVLAIMAILFAIAIPMVGDIQKTLELSRLDSYATDIYLAVENRLMAMKASGELLDLQGELYNNYATHSYTLVPEDYADAPYADRWVGGDNGSFRPQDWLDWTTEDNIIYENFFYVVHTPAGQDGGDPIIQTIVPTTTATEAVAGAYYIIEMNPTNGDLYGVFYADKPITFEDVLAMQTRSRDERKGVMIGYYTKGYTDVLTRGEMDAFQIKMSFINKEDLYLHVECDVRTAYFDRHDIVAGVTFHDTRDPEGTQYDLTVPIDLTDPTIWGKSAGSYSTFSVNLLLDSLEEGKTFADIFGSDSLTGFRNPFTYPQNKNCSGTFIPGDDIRATVDVHYSKAGRMMLTDTEHAADFPTRLTQNSLFESNDGHGSITVGYVRHLRNLGLYTYEGTEDVSIKQSQDISFTPTYLGSDGVARALWEEDARADGSLENPIDAFEPIYNTTLFAGTKTSTFDGQNNHLLYFTIAKANASDANVGLFARADGAKLQNIVMINPTVTGGNNTGALVGLAQSTTIINCGAHLDTIDPETDVYYPDMEDRINRYKVASSGETALGGLVGKATGATKLIGSYAAVLVDGADTVERVGGLVGEFDGSSAAGHAIEQCYTSEAQYGARYVGGLVGSFKGGTIGDCYAAGAVLADDHGGGLIGRIAGSGVQIVRSEAYGRVTKDDGYTLDRTYSRGFAGVSDYTAAFTSCRYLKQAGYNDDPTFETGLPSGIVPLEYEDLRVTPANNANDSHPYLMVNAIIFPFEMNTYYATSDTAKESPLVLDHYGDWPAEQSVQPSLVYYERYPDGYYGYYTVTSLASDLSHSNQWLLNTLRNGDGVYCVEDGYALLSVYHLTEYTYKLNDGTATNVQVGQNPALFEQMRVLPFDYTDENGNVLYDGDEPENERFELVYLYQLPFELQETGTNTQLYDKLEVTGAHALGNGSLNVIPGYIFYYSPRFAMTAVNPTIEQSPVIALAESGTPKATALGTASGEGFTTRNVNELSLAVRDRTARQGMALNITGKNRAAGDFEPASFVMTVGGHPDYIQAAYPDAQGLYLYSGSGSYYPMTAGVKGTYTSAPIEPGIVYTIYWKDSQGAYHQIYNMNRDQIGEVPTLQAGQTLYTGFNYVKLYKDAGVNQLFINGEEVEAERKYYFLHGFAHQPLGADGENNYPNQSIIRVTCTVKKGFMWHEWTWAEEGDGTLHDSWGHVREFSINVENGGWALKASTGSMDPTSVEYPNNNLNTLHVRSARQLNALGRYDYTWDWGCEIEAFTQDIDIDFAHYTTTYCGHTLDLTPAAQSEEDNAFANVPIGNDSKLFQKRYDGGGHKIIDYCQLNRDSDNVGLFGRVHGNTLTGIVLYASDPSAETPTAYVKSTNTTALHPVSDANDAYDYAPDGQPYMTFRQSGCALSVYWWDSHPEDINNELTRNAYLDFLKNQGVDRIYLDLGSRPLTDASVRATLHPFVAAANDRGIEIMPMYSEADPLMLSLAGARTTINNLIAGYQAYKTDYPHDGLSGYHFDVLPHQEGGDNNINRLTFAKLDHYANNFIRAAQAMRAAGITIEINVNCTWVSSGVGGDRVSYEDDTTHQVTTGIYNIVAKYTDRICTMPYADTAEGILTLMQDVLQAMDIYHTPLILGFETGHYPQWNSGDAEFAQESKEYMYTALARVYARLLEDYENIDGIAMHQHRTWQEMLSRRTMTLETAVPNVGALVGEVCDVNNVSNSMAITKGATYTMYLSDAPSGSAPAHSTYWGGLDIWTAPLQGAAQLNMKVTYSYADIGKEPPSKVTMNLYKGSSATPSLSVETTSFNGASTAFNRGISLPINDIRIEFVQTGGDEHAVTVTVTLSASTPTVIKNCCASGYQVIRESSAVYNVTTNLPDIRIQPNVGGLIGYNLGTVDNCYAASRQVVIDEPNTYVYRSLGGLIGRNGGEVTDSYAGGELKYNAVSGSQGTLTNAQIGGVVGRGEGKAASVKSCYSTCTVADQPYYHKAGVGGADHDEPVVYALADTTGNKVRKGSYLRGTYENAGGSTVVYPISDTLNLHDNPAFVKARSEAQMKELLNADVIGTRNNVDKSLALFCAESMKLVSGDYWVILDVYGSFPGLADPGDAMLELTGYRAYGTNTPVTVKALEASTSRIRFKVMGPLYMIGSNDFVVTIVGSEGVSRASDTRMCIQCGRYSQTQSTWDTKNGVSLTYWDESNGRSEIALYGSLFGDDTGSALKANSYSYNRAQRNGYPYPAVVKTADGQYAHYGTWPDSHGAITNLSARYNLNDYTSNFEIPTTYSWDSWSSFVSSMQSSALQLHSGDYVELIVQPEYEQPDPSCFGVFKCELGAMSGDAARYQCARYENGGTVTFEWVISQDTLLNKNSRLYFFADQSASGSSTRMFTLKSIVMNIYRAGAEDEEVEYTGTVNVTRDGTPTALASMIPGATGLAISQDGLSFVEMTPVDGATGCYTAPALVGVYNVFWVDGTGYHQLGDYQLRNSTPLELGYYTLTLRAGDGVASVRIDSGAAGLTASNVYLGGTGVTIHATMQDGHTWGQWIRTGGAPYNSKKDVSLVVTGTMDLTAQESSGGSETGSVQLKMAGAPYSADFIFNYDLGEGGLYLSADGTHYLMLTEDLNAGLYTCDQLEAGKTYQIYWFDGSEYHLISLMNEETVGAIPTVSAGNTTELHFHGVTVSGDSGIAQLTVNGVPVENGSTTAVLGAFGAPGSCEGYSIVRIAATVSSGYEFTGWTDGSGHNASYSFTIDDNHGGAIRYANSRLIGSYTGTVYVELDGARTPIGDVISGATGLAVSADGTTFTDMTTTTNGTYSVGNLSGTYSLYYKSGAQYDAQYHALGSYQIGSSTPVTASYYTVTLRGGSGVTGLSVNGGGATAILPANATATITATVANGYTWQRWVYTAGGAEYTDNLTYVATVTGTLDLTAQVSGSSQGESVVAQWVTTNGVGYSYSWHGTSYAHVYNGTAGLTNGTTPQTWGQFYNDHSSLADDEYMVITYTGSFPGVTAGSSVISAYGYTGITNLAADTATTSEITYVINGPVSRNAVEGDPRIETTMRNLTDAIAAQGDITVTVTIYRDTGEPSSVDSSEPDLSEPDSSEPDSSEPDSSEPDSSEDTLLSQWHSNKDNTGTIYYAYISGSQHTLQLQSGYKSGSSTHRGYMGSDTATNVSWREFLAAHGNLAADEYLLITYEGTLGLPANTTITELTRLGYLRFGDTDSDISYIASSDISANRIQLRINGPLTHTSIDNHFQVTASSAGITASSTPTDITMAGAIYKSGGGTGPVDDTIIYDEDVSATLTPGTDAVTYVNAAITEALQAETAAHGVAEQYLIWVTATTSTGDSFYPILIGSGGRAAWQNNDYEHHNWIDTSGTVSGVVLGSSLTGYGQTPVALGFASDTGTSSLTVSHIKIQVVRGETPPVPTTYTGTVNVTVNGTAAAIESAQSGATRLALSADNGSTYVDMTSSATGVYTATGLTQGSSYSVYWYNGTYHKLNGYTVSSATPVTVPYFTVTLRAGTGVTALSIDGTAVANGTPRTYLSGTGIQLNATVDTAHGYTWRDWANTAGGATRWLTRNTSVTVSEPLDLTARADYQAAVIVRKNGTPGSIVDIYASATGLKLRNTADASDERTLTYNGDNKTYTCEGLTPGSQYQVMWEYDASTLTRIGDFVILDGTVLTIDYYTVTLTGDAGVASMTVNGEAATSGTAYTYLAGTVSINATAGSGYTWLGWYNTANDSLYQANASVPNITLNGALALTAKTEAEGSGGEPTLLSEWHANLGGVDGKPSYLHGRYGSLTINQYSYDAGYLTSAPGTNVTWPQFLAAHGNLAADEYIVLTYENASGLGLTAGTDPAAITALTNFGYTGVTNASIASAEITPTKIRLRINGPLTVAAAANMSLTVSGCSLNSVDVTNGTFMTGQIYKEGSGSSEPDDTVITSWQTSNGVAERYDSSFYLRKGTVGKVDGVNTTWQAFVEANNTLTNNQYMLIQVDGSFPGAANATHQIDLRGYRDPAAADGTDTYYHPTVDSATDSRIVYRMDGPIAKNDNGKNSEAFFKWTGLTGAISDGTDITVTVTIYEHGAGDDTVIFDADVSGAVNLTGAGDEKAFTSSAITAALDAETAAHGIAAQYLVTVTVRGSSAATVYPIICADSNHQAWPDRNSDHNYGVTTGGGTIYATILGSNFTATDPPDHLYFYAENATNLTISHVKIEVVRS